MTRTLAAAALLLVVSWAPGWAKNFAVPAANPAATITIPDTWETSEIDHGYSAYSPGKDVFFSIESADSGTVKAMMDNTVAWMKDNNIVPTSPPQEKTEDFNGLKGTVYHREAKDDDGPTNIDFVIIPLSGERILFLTLWASDDDMKTHGSDFQSIVMSLKPIN